MELPKFELPTRQGPFDIRFRQFVQERFPELTLTVETVGEARIYTVVDRGARIGQIETLPFTTDRLEVRVARLTADDKDFCGKFYQWVGPAHGIRLAKETASAWVSGLVTQPVIERLAEYPSDDPKREELRQRMFEQSQRGLPSLPQDETDSARKRGPTIKTQERAKVFRRLKDKHPNWSQAKVALEANLDEGVDYYTEDCVRNAYRAMGWTWERADRVR